MSSGRRAAVNELGPDEWPIDQVHSLTATQTSIRPESNHPAGWWQFVVPLSTGRVSSRTSCHWGTNVLLVQMANEWKRRAGYWFSCVAHRLNSFLTLFLFFFFCPLILEAICFALIFIRFLHFPRLRRFLLRLPVRSIDGQFNLRPHRTQTLSPAATLTTRLPLLTWLPCWPSKSTGLDLDGRYSHADAAPFIRWFIFAQSGTSSGS